MVEAEAGAALGGALTGVSIGSLVNQSQDFHGKNVRYPNPPALYLRRFLGRECDEALFREKKGFSVKRREAIR